MRKSSIWAEYVMPEPSVNAESDAVELSWDDADLLIDERRRLCFDTEDVVLPIKPTTTEYPLHWKPIPFNVWMDQDVQRKQSILSIYLFYLTIY